METNRTWQNCSLRPALFNFPFVMESSFEDGEFKPTGAAGILITEVFKILGFKAKEETMSIANDMEIGEVFENGTSTGLLSFLTKNISDFICVPINYKYNAFKELDFTTPIHYSEMIFVSGPPVFTRFDIFAPFQIFNMEVWIAITIATAFLSVTWTFALRMTEQIMPIYEVIARIFSIALNKSVTCKNMLSSRILWGTWICCSFVLNLAFTSCLLAKVTMPDIPHLIDTKADLLQYPNLKVFFFEGSPIDTFTKYSDDPKTRAVREQATRTGGITKMEEIDIDKTFLELLASRVVFISDPSFVYVTLNFLDGGSNYPNAENFHLGKESLFTFHIALALRRDVDPVLADRFKTVVYRMSTHGICTRIRNRAVGEWEERLAEMMDSSEVPPEPLKLKNIFLPFIFLFCGIVISLFTFLWEIFTQAHANHKAGSNP